MNRRQFFVLILYTVKFFLDKNVYVYFPASETASSIVFPDL